MIYLLIAVTCSIKEPSKVFQLTCKPTVNRFFLAEKECESNRSEDSVCLAIKVNK